MSSQQAQTDFFGFNQLNFICMNKKQVNAILPGSTIVFNVYDTKGKATQQSGIYQGATQPDGDYLVAHVAKRGPVTVPYYNVLSATAPKLDGVAAIKKVTGRSFRRLPLGTAVIARVTSPTNPRGTERRGLLVNKYPTKSASSATVYIPRVGFRCVPWTRISSMSV